MLKKILNLKLKFDDDVIVIAIRFRFLDFYYYGNIYTKGKNGNV